jgi:hypothetical protein
MLRSAFRKEAAMRPVLCRRLFVLSLLSLFTLTSQAAADRIEAVQGKQYNLTKRHGPWMIMVASFHAASRDGQVREGKPPQQIADELVYELRQRQIPAYTFAISPDEDAVRTIDRLGREETRTFLTQQEHISVIAGNYPSATDATAQKTLAYIKKLYPDCLQQNGVKYLQTNRRKGPLGGAFLTVNPMLTPEEIKAREQDPLLVKLNAGGKYSLYDNKGKYSLVVATFSGKKMAHIGDSNSAKAHEAFSLLSDTSKSGSDGFGRFWKKDQESDLNAASANAWELAVCLRERDKIDAYVWHDRYQSVVTVGSFESPNDPTLKRYLMVFAPSPIAQTGGTAGDQVVFPGAPSRNFGVAAGGGNKIYAVSGFGEKGNENRLWAFDPTPVMMRVPQR